MNIIILKPYRGTSRILDFVFKMGHLRFKIDIKMKCEEAIRALFIIDIIDRKSRSRFLGWNVASYVL